MQPYVKERSDRLHSICDRVNHEDKRMPLMVPHKFTEDEFHTLRTYVNIYLYNSLQTIIPGQYSLHFDFLKHYSELIRRLPNITPNGLLLPKKHNFLAYNMIYQFLVPLIEKMKLTDVARIQRSINIRLIDGTPNQTVDSRPRSSTKPHSDIWAGEFSNHFTLQIPIIGDMDNNGINLWEPGASFFPKYVTALNDFNDGKEALADSTRYATNMSLGYGYFMDSFLLHQTRKQAPGYRLNLAVTFITESKLSSDLVYGTERKDEYIPTEQWLGYGRDRIVMTKAEVRDYSKEDLSIVKNKYAEDYKIIELD